MSRKADFTKKNVPQRVRGNVLHFVPGVSFHHCSPITGSGEVDTLFWSAFPFPSRIQACPSLSCESDTGADSGRRVLERVGLETPYCQQLTRNYLLLFAWTPIRLTRRGSGSAVKSVVKRATESSINLVCSRAYRHRSSDRISSVLSC